MINLKNIAVLLFSLVVPGLAIAQTEVLYNGIHLPEQWPPRYAEPQKAGSNFCKCRTATIC